MNILYLLIPLSLLMATLFLAAFIWAVRTGQYRDTHTPSLRVILDSDEGPTPAISTDNEDIKKQP